jgi:hypothetical protein
MKTTRFNQLSETEQGEAIYQHMLQLAEMLQQANLDDGAQTIADARVYAELCRCEFCDRCDVITYERDSWGLCPICAGEQDQWANDMRELERDYIFNTVNVRE